jgi:teneurin
LCFVFTKSFDIMINGGGSVKLEFARTNLKTEYTTVNTNWNEFINIDTVIMHLYNDIPILTKHSPCDHISFSSLILENNVLTSSKSERSFYPQNSIFTPDAGLCRAQVDVKSNFKLVYTTNQASGYSSSIYVTMTRHQIPNNLQIIHLKITVEGIIYKQTFDAYTHLTYEYSWNRRNAYEQRVYGQTFAKVMIGYQYDDCSFIYWQYFVVKIDGYDLLSSEIGNWNIDVHHRLNIQQQLLNKGDGSLIDLKEQEQNQKIEISIGHLNIKRDLDCSNCDNNFNFYSPYSLTINKDGTLFIADYNFIWMINSTQTNGDDERPQKILKLNLDQPYKYFINTNPIDGALFMSDPINRQILSVKSLSNIKELKENSQIVSGFTCDDSNQHQCQISASKIQYPKGFAFDNNGVLYFIDANKIKTLYSGVITTLIDKDETDNYEPMICKYSYSFNEIKLHWPTNLLINPNDNSVYILDGDVIYRITTFNTVDVVVGKPKNCYHKLDKDSIVYEPLQSPVDISFNSNGDLFILENNKADVKRIRFIEQGKHHFIKTLYNGIQTFSDPISLAVHPNRSVYIIDRGHNVVYHLRNSLSRDDYSGKYSVISKKDNEMFIFNPYGLHLHTIDTTSGKIKYNFTYNGNALYGKLVTITDATRTRLTIKRDFHGRPLFIQTESESYKLKLNNFGLLRNLASSVGQIYNFTYLSNSGLISTVSMNIQQQQQHQTDNKEKIYSFDYFKNGKIEKINDNNQLITNISYFINDNNEIVTEIKRNDRFKVERWSFNGTHTAIFKG